MPKPAGFCGNCLDMYDAKRKDQLSTAFAYSLREIGPAKNCKLLCILILGAAEFSAQLACLG